MQLFLLTLILSQTVFQRSIFSFAASDLGETIVGFCSNEKLNSSVEFSAPISLFSNIKAPAITDLQLLHVIKLA